MQKESATAVFENGLFVGCYWLYLSYDLGVTPPKFSGLKLHVYRVGDGQRKIAATEDEAIRFLEEVPY